MIQYAHLRRFRLGVAGAVLLAFASGCSAGDPPNPDAARATATTVADPDDERDEAAEEDEEELSDPDDATLDALEERFEDQGVKDIRGKPGQGVTIRLEDELTVAHAAAACAAVRAAGFADVNVDIDDDVTPCP